MIYGRFAARFRSRALPRRLLHFSGGHKADEYEYRLGDEERTVVRLISARTADQEEEQEYWRQRGT
jgi:hypothetical protein